EDEIGYPDFAVERFAVKGLPGFRDQLEARDLSVNREPRLPGGASADDKERDDAQDFHAELVVLFRLASAADDASSRIPNTTVTARLVTAPGDPSVDVPGISRLLSRAVA